MPKFSRFQDKSSSARRKEPRRPRPIISCSECRARKLRCSRTLPCDQCNKARRGNQCVFFAKSDHAASKSVPTASISSPASSDASATASANSTNSEADSPWPPCILKVFGNETSYLCAGHWRFILDKFGQVDSILAKSLAEPALKKLREQLEFLLPLHQQSRILHSPQLFTPSPSIDFLFQLLPSESCCNELLDVYCQNQEATHRILHIPSFMLEYRQFWEAPSSQRLAWLPHLLVILATGAFLQDHVSLPGGLARADFWLQFVDHWIHSLNGMFVSDEIVLQTHCMLLIAGQMIPQRRRRQLSDPGRLLAAAMVAGLHRDPSHFRQLSIFRGEIQRRLWASVLELCIQFSLSFNLPPVVKTSDYDSLPPANADDSALAKLMETPPESAPHGASITDASYQNILATCLKPRLRVLEILNRLGDMPGYDEVVQVTNEINTALDNIPIAMAINRANDSASGTMRRRGVLLNAYLGRPLLMLHSAIWCHQGTSAQLAEFSRRTATETAMRILSYVQIFSGSSALDQGLRSSLYTELTIDIFQACLVICLEIRTLDQETARNASLPSDLEHRACLMATVEAAFDDYLSRIPLPIMPMAPIYLSIVIAALKSPNREELSEIRTRQYLEKIVIKLQSEVVTSGSIYVQNNANEPLATTDWSSNEDLDTQYPIGEWNYSIEPSRITVANAHNTELI